jgi:hypothetical protein
MTVILQEHLIQSVADALQYISYYHSKDFVEAMGRAWEREQSPAAKDAIAQILTNSRLCAEGHRPICQDTGIVNVFLKIGMGVRLEGFAGSVADAVNEGVRRAYLDPDNTLRASILSDPLFSRKNTKDNTRGHPHGSRSGRHRGRDGRRERRRLGEQIEIRDARPFRFRGGLGIEDRAHHGRGLVPAGTARHRRRRHRRESDAARQGIADGSHRHA